MRTTRQIDYHGDRYIVEFDALSEPRTFVIDPEGDRVFMLPCEASDELLRQVIAIQRSAAAQGERVGRAMLQRELRSLLGAAEAEEG